MVYARLVFALLVVLAGCAQAPQSASPSATVPTATTESTTSQPQSATPSPTPSRTPEPSQTSPATLGVEEGIAYHDPLKWVNSTDGLNDSELRAVVARSMARVEHLRRIEFDFSLPIETISRRTFRAEYATGNTSQERRFFENGKLEALFLVGEDEDAVAIQRESVGSSVLGFYDAEKDRIVLVTDGESAAISEPILGHELVHALQYHRFNASRYERSTLDRSNAISGLLEGDARYLDLRYAEQCRANWSCVTPQASFGFGSGGGGIPHFGLYYLTYFPYSDGPIFIDYFNRSGGWERVNSLYSHPPASAEQVIDPSKYRNDSPTPVSVQDRSADDWSRVRPANRSSSETVGQAGIASMFAYPTFHPRAGLVVSSRYLINRDGSRLRSLDPFEYGFAYADGWDGDTLWIYRNSSGELGYVWRIVWDSNTDAQEFAAGYRSLLEHWGAEPTDERSTSWRIPENDSEFADAFAIHVQGPRVTIVNAPSEDTLDDVHAPAAEW